MEESPPPYAERTKLSLWVLSVPILVLLNVLIISLRSIVVIVQLILTSILLALEILTNHLKDSQKRLVRGILSTLQYT
jgi:hypothetical protein